MSPVERNAWISFKKVCSDFLGNRKSADYKKIISNMVKKLERLECNMSSKLHMMDSYVDEFPDNVGDFSEEQGKRFHQDFKDVERRFQGRWDKIMMADFCWMLQRASTHRG